MWTVICDLVLEALFPFPHLEKGKGGRGLALGCFGEKKRLDAEWGGRSFSWFNESILGQSRCLSRRLGHSYFILEKQQPFFLFLPFCFCLREVLVLALDFSHFSTSVSLKLHVFQHLHFVLAIQTVPTYNPDLHSHISTTLKTFLLGPSITSKSHVQNQILHLPVTFWK